MSNWQIIDSGPLTAEQAMAKDFELLAQLDPHDKPSLHFYDWLEPCLTYGYFTDPARHLHIDALTKYQLTKARRPTGGGIIFHLADFSFSVSLPACHPGFSMNTMDNYAWVNRKVAAAIGQLTGLKPDLLKQPSMCFSKECYMFCMAKPTQYDLMLNGKKMGGAAQRKTRRGLLHQTSLSLFLPPFEIIREVLIDGEQVINAMQFQSAALYTKSVNENDCAFIRKDLKQSIINAFLTSSPN